MRISSGLAQAPAAVAGGPAARLQSQAAALARARRSSLRRQWLARSPSWSRASLGISEECPDGSWEWLSLARVPADDRGLFSPPAFPGIRSFSLFLAPRPVGQWAGGSAYASSSIWLTCFTWIGRPRRRTPYERCIMQAGHSVVRTVAPVFPTLSIFRSRTPAASVW